ncbi:hematopoietic death receptor isoform X3 [Epinephelus fuscoguttatus]|uniref:hematopoietic death receptor isoform X3 n=1 Tax=Epinephelus fuscoguttatus TaxID=293821 RepID=UPI0020D0876A|nr:hematopoietic death receptor isoform X3 [Epinephelus fuscoguttatus]
MTEWLQCLVYFLLMWPLKPMGAFPRSSRDVGGSRTQWDVPCRENLEYQQGNICCLNCPAGTRLISPCDRAGRRGQCEECDDGTYTEHDNGLKHCFKCTQCHSDQEIVRPCTHTQDTECQCKLGRFCDPDDACEVCKRCSRCGTDEVVVRNCTPTANTECKKIQPISDSTSAGTSVTLVCVVIVGVVLVIGIMVFIFVRRRRATGSQRNPDGLKAGQHHSDTCPAEESSNGETRRPSRMNLIPSRQLEDEQFPTLVPVNGEESLRSCLPYFEEIDYDLHKRFFRHLGINDNEIKSRESLPYDDKIHELLKVWMEKRGREASLNDLLKALLDLNHRRTAEIIKEKALDNGHYVCKC